MKQYILNVLIGLDQWGNAILGGDPQETISSRAGRQEQDKAWARYLCRFLNWLEPGHCQGAVKNLPGHLEKDDSVLP